MAQNTFHQNITIAKTSAPVLQFLETWQANMGSVAFGGDVACMGNDHFAHTDEGNPTDGINASTLRIYRRDASVKSFSNQKLLVTLPVPFLGDEYEQFRGVTYNEHNSEIVTLVGNELGAVFFRAYDTGGQILWQTANVGLPIYGLCFDGRFYYSTYWSGKIGQAIQYMITNLGGASTNVASIDTFFLPATTTRYAIAYDGYDFAVTYTVAARVNHSIVIALVRRDGTTSIAQSLASGTLSIAKGLEYDGHDFCHVRSAV